MNPVVIVVITRVRYFWSKTKITADDIISRRRKNKIKQRSTRLEWGGVEDALIRPSILPENIVRQYA